MLTIASSVLLYELDELDDLCHLGVNGGIDHGSHKGKDERPQRRKLAG
jgi:hypothetical protein